ncbi:unnamed protein product [Chironomus riparius]|nr:unnamed protein product [Chironomus riparius]
MHIHHKSNQFSNSIKVLLLLLITYISWCNAVSEEEVKEALRLVDEERNNPARYCGRRLNHVMKFVCKREVRGMIGPQYEKKSLDPTKDLDLSVFYNDRVDNYEEDDSNKNRFKGNEFDDLLPFNDLALSRFQARNRQRRGIIDECCRNPCSWSNLVKYCPTMG